MLNNKDKREYLFSLLDELNEHERNVIIERYGFNSGKMKTYEELAEEFSLSHQRISAYVVSILEKLKQIINNNYSEYIYMDYIKCSDNIFEQLIYYLDLGLEKDTILSLMNLEGFHLTITDLDYYVFMLYKIIIFINDGKLNNDKNILLKLNKKFSFNFSEEFIRRLINFNFNEDLIKKLEDNFKTKKR